MATLVGVLIGAALATAAWAHKHRPLPPNEEAHLDERVRALAESLTGAEPESTHAALDSLAIGIAELRSDATRLLHRMAEMSRRLQALQDGDASREAVLSATRRTLQTHLSRLGAERDGLVTRIDRLTSFASGGIEYSEPLPDVVGTDLEDEPTDPPDLPFDHRGGGANRGRA